MQLRMVDPLSEHLQGKRRRVTLLESINMGNPLKRSKPSVGLKLLCVTYAEGNSVLLVCQSIYLSASRNGIRLKPKNQRKRGGNVPSLPKNSMRLLKELEPRTLIPMHSMPSNMKIIMTKL